MQFSRCPVHQQADAFASMADVNLRFKLRSIMAAADPLFQWHAKKDSNLDHGANARGYDTNFSELRCWWYGDDPAWKG